MAPLLRRTRLSVTEINRQIQERREQALKERLANFDVPRRDSDIRGRPPVVLPPWMAQAVLADLAARCTQRWAAQKYKLSARWIRDAARDGRLTKMAEGKYGTPNHP